MKKRFLAISMLLLSVLMFGGCAGDPPDFIDLTAMSGTAVEGQVNDMMNIRPKAYIGKTVKAEGIYATNYWESTDTTYHLIEIKDAAACCSSGIEFLYGGVLPPVGTAIQIEGKFDKYEENNIVYYYIAVSVLEIKDNS